MAKIYPKLLEADIIILASPIFFYGVTAWAKGLIDRCQALWALKYLLKKPISLVPKEKRRALFVAVGGTRLKDTFSPSLVIVKTWLRILDFGYAGELTYPGIDEAGAIKQHPSALHDAFAAGQKLAED